MAEIFYHGSPYGGLDSFENYGFDRIFLTRSKAVAREYTKKLPAAGKKPASFSGDERPTVYAVDPHLDPSKIFDTRKPEHREIYDRISKETRVAAKGDEDAEWLQRELQNVSGGQDTGMFPDYGTVKLLQQKIEPLGFNATWIAEGSQGASLMVFGRASISKMEIIDPSVNEAGETKKGISSGGTPLTTETIKAILNPNVQKLKRRIGTTKLSFLGKGSNGVAYDIGNGRVLKITKDPREAMAMAVVKSKGQGKRHIVRIFDVFRFDQNVIDDQVFGIVQEKLQPLGADESELKGVFKALVPDNSPELYALRNWDLNSVVSRIKHRESQEWAIEMIKKYQIDGMVRDLASLRIKFHDYHAGNVMKRGDDFVLIDLGVSDVERAESIPQLEAFVSALTDDLSEAAAPPPVPRDALPKAGEELDDKADARLASVLRANAGLLRDRKKIDVQKMRLLGTGTRGAAFDLQNGRVMKVSFDHVEASAALKIIGKELFGVSRIFDVFKFRNTGVYGIVQEKLSPISNSESRELDTAVVNTKIREALHSCAYDWELAVDFAARAIHTKTPEKAAKFNEYISILEKKYMLPKIIQSLNSLGVKYHDFHAGNMMKRGDQYVVIDLGYSKVSGGQEAPVLEQFVESIIGELTETDAMPSYAVRATEFGKAGGSDAFDAALSAKAKSLMDEYGIDVRGAKQLGHGAMGMAYRLTKPARSGAQVIKITTDYEEAKTSHYMRSRNLKNAVKIYDVFELGNLPSNTRMWGITQELLTPLSEPESNEFDTYMGTYAYSAECLRQLAMGTWETFLDEVWDQLELDIREDLAYPEGSDPNSAKDTQLTKSFEKRKGLATAFFRKYNIDKIVPELRAAGIEFADYHGGNMMKRGGEFVICDLGKSKSPGGAPPVLEGLDGMIAAAAIEILG